MLLADCYDQVVLAVDRFVLTVMTRLWWLLTLLCPELRTSFVLAIWWLAFWTGMQEFQMCGSSWGVLCVCGTFKCKTLSANQLKKRVVLTPVLALQQATTLREKVTLDVRAGFIATLVSMKRVEFMVSFVLQRSCSECTVKGTMLQKTGLVLPTGRERWK